MLARDADIVAIDFETTGSVRGQANLPWQIGITAVHQGRLLADCGMSRYLNVPKEHHFNPYAPGRWGEIREVLAQSPTILFAWPELSPWLTGHPLMAHNAPTERKILKDAFPIHKFGPWIDTLSMSRMAYPHLESHALSDVLDVLELTPKVEDMCPNLAPHDAYYDAVGCACLFEHIIALPAWNDVSLEYLFAI